ncbi:LysR family transcriptional regulator [Paenibacillus periandrae]|uniref:LysR family transcriptional regulator n=1 Tax=Paenibacillus periandrae TaxID=1761741 RepID=UPI001F0A0219|nr:LysR family transcriptional regulator [Paenibacillus periandrae]
MEEKDWYLLKMLYKEKNITKTAEHLYISQPALTYRIQQLEKEFGIRIVSRGKKGVEFTSQGELLVVYAEKMLLELLRVKEMIQNMNDRVEGTLRIGVNSSFMRYRLPKLLKEFANLYPNVEINVKSGWSSEVINSVYKEEVHVGIFRGDHHWQEQAFLLSKEPFYIASRDPIDLEDLPNLPRINYKITDYNLRHIIEKWWHQRFTKPSLITMEVDSVETCVELIRNGLGFAFVPGISLQDQDTLSTIHLYSRDGQPIIRETWMIYRDATLDLSVVKAFVDFMKSRFNTT